MHGRAPVDGREDVVGHHRLVLVLEVELLPLEKACLLFHLVGQVRNYGLNLMLQQELLVQVHIAVDLVPS